MRAFFCILVFTWVAVLFLPWWGVLIPALLFGFLLLERAGPAFGLGFAGAGLAWFFHALYIHVANDAILSTRMAEMMGVGSPWVVLLMTFLVAALPGGFGALTGYLLKKNLNSLKISS